MTARALDAERLCRFLRFAVTLEPDGMPLLGSSVRPAKTIEQTVELTAAPDSPGLIHTVVRMSLGSRVAGV
jgi:hypothetical protein